MLETLEETIEILPQLLGNEAGWDSIVINRRKPYTYRAFYQNGPYRICLHRFESCDEEEAFYHPHPWPGAFKVLEGGYKMRLGRAPGRIQAPLPVCTIILNEGSSYEITDPLTFHTVEPVGKECFTVMVNGEPWAEDVRHKDVRTTKGKILDKMTTDELKAHLNKFRELLRKWNAS